jgi:hypothetical protein
MSLIAQVTAVNDAPVVQLSSSSFTVAQLGVGQAFANGVSITDVDSAIMGWASVSLGAGYQINQDSLYVETASVDASTRGLISAQWNSSTGELTLTGNASKSQYAAMLSALRFATTSTSIGTREVIINVSDGQRTSSATSATANIRLSVTVSTPDSPQTPGGKIDGTNPITGAATEPAPDRTSPAIGLLPGGALPDEASAAQEEAEQDRRRRSAAISFNNERLRQQTVPTNQRYVSRLGPETADGNAFTVQGLILSGADNLLSTPDANERAANTLQLGRQSGRIARLSEQEEVRIAEELAKQSRAMQQDEFDITAAQATTAGAAAFATLLLWTVRAGGIVAAIATSAPAWRNLDPMPLLLEDKSDADREMWSDDDNSTQALAGPTYMQAAALLEKV